MGAMSELYASRMRGPEPDEADEWIMQMAQVMRAKRERQVRRLERILTALHEAAAETTDEGELFV